MFIRKIRGKFWLSPYRFAAKNITAKIATGISASAAYINHRRPSGDCLFCHSAASGRSATPTSP